MLHRRILRINNMVMVHHDRNDRSPRCTVAVVVTPNWRANESRPSERRVDRPGGVLSGVNLLLKPLHEASQNRRDVASLQPHLNETKAIFYTSCIQGRTQVRRRMHLEATSAPELRQLGKWPQDRVIITGLWEKGLKHFPAAIVEQDNNRIQAIARALRNLRTRHLEAAVPH